MIKVKNYDIEKYKELLEELGNCRRGNRSHRLYEGLQIITPDGYMSDDIKKLLDKRADTKHDKSWGNCKQVANSIRDLLFK
ncbi:MAG: hypothetical protein WCE94_05440 [Candidatus Methanoperedens sp.]